MTLNEQVMTEVRADLASFADTHSRLDVSGDGAAWVRQGASYEATFLQGAAYPDVRLNGAKKKYSAFLASEELANLKALAESIYLSGANDDRYIEPRARTEETEEPGDGDRPIGDLIGDLLDDLPHGATRVVFLRGAAGAGKTVALRQLAHRQADAYLSHQANFLYLYIDAQARYLARLDDAVALVLQDLNARFTYRALATLTRHRLVVPIIDGFDELIGAGSGGETIDALARFLARLNGRGATIVSTRSTHFDFSRLRASADRLQASDAGFAIVPVDLQPWTRQEMCAYLEKTEQYKQLDATSSAEALERVESFFPDDGGTDLFSTPFFLAAAVEIAREPASIGDPARPIRRIIDSFVRREVDKFLDSQDRPILTEEGHWRFIRMLAEEMWWQERRELDKGSVDTIAELFADEVAMPENDLRAFIDRASAYAFLATQSRNVHGNGSRMLAFSHEYYYAFFVARFLAESLASDEDPASLLGRSRISPTVATEFAEHVAEEGPAFLASILGTLSARRVPVPTRETNRGNAGALYEALVCKHKEISDLHLVEASFTGANFRDTVQRDVTVERCDFVDADFRDANWSFRSSKKSTYARLAIDTVTTRLKNLRLEIGTDLHGIGNRMGRTEYDPAKVAAICDKIGIRVPSQDLQPAPERSERAEATMELLHKLFHVSERMYYLSDDVLAQRGISNSPYWSDLDGLLRSHDLIEDKKMQKRGATGRLRRLAYPPGIIAKGEGGTTEPAIRAFWKAVREL